MKKKKDLKSSNLNIEVTYKKKYYFKWKLFFF